MDRAADDQRNSAPRRSPLDRAPRGPEKVKAKGLEPLDLEGLAP